MSPEHMFIFRQYYPLVMLFCPKDSDFIRLDIIFRDHTAQTTSHPGYFLFSLGSGLRVAYFPNLIDLVAGISTDGSFVESLCCFQQTLPRSLTVNTTLEVQDYGSLC